MRRTFLAVLASVLVSACSSISPETKKLVGQPAPYTRVTLLDGQYVPLSTFQGKTVVLAFWASWCSRSKKVMGALAEYARSHPNPDVAYLAVSIDRNDSYETLRNVIHQQRLNNLQHAFSGNDVRDETFLTFRMIAVPTIVVISPGGIVKGVDDGIGVVEEFVP